MSYPELPAHGASLVFIDRATATFEQELIVKWKKAEVATKDRVASRERAGWSIAYQATPPT